MNYDILVQNLTHDTKVSLQQFLPELTLCTTIILMLVLRVSDTTRRYVPSWLIALLGAMLALWFSQPWKHLGSDDYLGRAEMFTGMLVYDTFTIYFRSLLAFFTVLFIILTRITGLADDENAPDFYTLVLGAVLGMCLMASANHLLVIFLAVEMASVPSYALAGILKGSRKGSEAAIKYAVYGAGAAGVMLYGTSLIAGVVGSAHLPTIAWRLAMGVGAEYPLVLVLATMMFMVGVAFKLSAVPFHFWCPDVFEGASAEVNAFLSVASKAAALALLVRVVVGFAAPPDHEPQPFGHQAAAQQQQEPVVIASAGPTAVDTEANVAKIREFLAYIVAFLAAITCTFGNLAAFGQTNIKRLLAYSTIAHAGYMMMPVAAGLMLMNTNPDAAPKAFASLLVYIAIYVFMNLGAFAIVAFLRDVMGSEEIADYAGLVRSSPGIVVCFCAILLSLVGLPPLAGFMAKLVIFAGLADVQMYTLLVIGGLNGALSLFYYLRVVKTMTFEPEPDDRAPIEFSMVSIPGIYVAIVTAPVMFLILHWSGLHEWAMAACQTVVGP